MSQKYDTNTIKRKSIPRIIWTYWHDHTNIPDIVKKCIESWKNSNPDHRVIILNKELVKKLCEYDLDTLNVGDFHARVADFARLLIVAKYGGIWMDSSIICTESLAWVHKHGDGDEGCDLVGFYAPFTTNMKYPVTENWFFAAPVQSEFMKDWLSEALFMTTFPSESAYVDYISMNTRNFEWHDMRSSLPYLIMHLCASVVQQRNYGKYKMYMYNALEGPFKYLSENNWELPKSFESLCKNKSLQTPLIKMRGKERNYLIQNSVACETSSDIINRIITGQQ